MTDALRSGPITFQRQRLDGSWEDIPGWISVDEYGNVHCRVLDKDEIEVLEQFKKAMDHLRDSFSREEA